MMQSPHMNSNFDPNMLLGRTDDEVVELRFSDIDMETADMISGIISEEAEGVAKDDVDGTATNRNKVKSGRGVSITTERSAAMRFSQGTEGRPSVLSVRPSLMSLGMSDRFLERVINQTSERSLKSSRISGNSSMGTWATSFSVFDRPSVNLGNDEPFDPFRTSLSASPPSLTAGATASPHIPLKAPMGLKVNAKQRISIVADPFLFSQEGAPIHMDTNLSEVLEKSMELNVDPSIFEKVEHNNLHDSTGPPPFKKPYGVQFSVSRETLDLLDEESSFSSEQDDLEPFNPVPETLKDPEDFLTREAEKMSVEDKTRVNFEVHGIPHMENSDPEPQNIDWYLQQLEQELQRITRPNDAVREAQRMNPEYVNRKEFLLMFLRLFVQENAFDVKQAAAKMVLYFDTKKLIFGCGEILGRDVRLSDLSVDDRAAMDSGAWQTMPDRDAAGRVVVFYAPGQRIFKTVEHWMRAMWYMLNLIAKDEGNQKSGVVMVMYLRGFGSIRDNIEEAKKIAIVRDAIPQKFAALHYCYNDDSMTALVTAQKIHFLTRNQRSHTRDHLGSHNEVCFRLETYGIHIDRKILLENGHLGMAWYNQWIKLREAAEAETPSITSGAATSTVETTVIPNNFDVLFGRGRNTREHCGNLRCAVLVEMYQQQYESCSKAEKTAIAERIIDMVKECGGKFLKKDRKYGWQEVPDNKAREKVAHFFRHLRALDKTKDNNDDDCGITESQKRTLPF